MNPQYRPENLTDALIRLNEECVEVAKECCKGLRFGLHDCDPNKDDGGMKNIDRIKAEMNDLLGAFDDMIRFYDLACRNVRLNRVCTHIFDTSMHDYTRKCCLCGEVMGREVPIPPPRDDPMRKNG